jgi:hypothetical protein
MQTLLDIDDDVIEAARVIAVHQQKTLDQVISELARIGAKIPPASPADPVRWRNGFPVLPKRGEVITLEHVRRLMEEEGI